MKPKHTSYFRINLFAYCQVQYFFAVYRSNIFKFSYLEFHISRSVLHNGSLIYFLPLFYVLTRFQKLHIVRRFQSSSFPTLSVNVLKYCRLCAVHDIIVQLIVRSHRTSKCCGGEALCEGCGSSSQVKYTSPHVI